MYNKLFKSTYCGQISACSIKWCVFVAKTEKRYDASKGFIRVKRESPAVYGMPIVTFDTFCTDYGIDDVNRFGDGTKGLPWVYGYTMWALRRGDAARRYFPESVHDTEEAMMDAIEKLTCLKEVTQ